MEHNSGGPLWTASEKRAAPTHCSWTSTLPTRSHTMRLLQQVPARGRTAQASTFGIFSNDHILENILALVKVHPELAEEHFRVSTISPHMRCHWQHQLGRPTMLLTAWVCGPSGSWDRRTQDPSPPAKGAPPKATSGAAPSQSAPPPTAPTAEPAPEEVEDDDESDVELTAEERAEVARIEEECSALERRMRDLSNEGPFGHSATVSPREPRQCIKCGDWWPPRRHGEAYRPNAEQGSERWRANESEGQSSLGQQGPQIFGRPEQRTKPRRSFRPTSLPTTCDSAPDGVWGCFSSTPGYTGADG